MILDVKQFLVLFVVAAAAATTVVVRYRHRYGCRTYRPYDLISPHFILFLNLFLVCLCMLFMMKKQQPQTELTASVLKKNPKHIRD